MTRFGWLVVVGAVLLSGCGHVEAEGEMQGSENVQDAEGMGREVSAMSCQIGLFCDRPGADYVCCYGSTPYCYQWPLSGLGWGASCEPACPGGSTPCGATHCCAPAMTCDGQTGTCVAP